MSELNIETQAVALRPAMSVGQALGVDEIIAQVTLIQQVMHKVMKEGEHFGKVPGCGDKKTLLQPGAQKLTMTFRLAPEYEIQEVNLDRGHKEYRVTCTLKSIQSGTFVGQGVGCCSTMESKYRWRQGEGKPTGRPVPKAYWDTRDVALLGGKGFIARKLDEQWQICEKGERVENDNPADCYNTVLKMAKKRAFVDATITATAASDIFTQDIGDEEAEQEQTKSLSPTAPVLANGPGPTTEVGKPGDDPNWFWGVICPIPRKGMTRADYLKKPETVLDLYNFAKQGDDSAKKRLFGFANNWTPEARTVGGKTYQPSEAEFVFRKALDAFLEFEKEKHQKQSGEAEPELIPANQAEDDVPF